MPHPDCARVPMVLCNASYYGTVAAIRSLGRAGIPVVAVDTGLLSTGRRSRYAKSYLSSPPFDSADWSDWLLALGRDGVRRAIYATSDAVSFALADRREELSSVFDLYQPSLESMMCILDKGLLHRHARAVGIETPETWFPQSANEADGIVREVGGQIVAKPRSQLCASSGAKGMLISAVTNRGSVYDRLFKHFGLSNAFTKRFPEMAMPMLQRYHPEAMKKIYSLSGFRDRSGSHIVMQAALKILQQPRHLGIGVCFEEAEVIPDIAQKTIRLCERIGYYGAFELEFIVAQGQMLLIDFNGRFYNQLAFDIARGMDLPGMVYASATGATEELERLVSRVPPRDKEKPPLVFCNGFGLSLSMAAQQLFKKMSREEATHWLEWRKTYKGRVVDAIHDSDDPLPAVFDIASRVGEYMRYPRKFFGDMAFKQTHVLATVAAGSGIL